MPTPPFEGFDCPVALPNLADKGFSFAIKYVADSTAWPDKRLTHEERSMCLDAGVRNGFVFERGNTIDYFACTQGFYDARATIDYFRSLGVAPGVACFFAADFDANPEQIQGPIRGYAMQFHAGLKAAGFAAGVYGSGATCKALLSAGVVHFTWLAASTGWAEYENWKQSADIVQDTSSVLGINSDHDIARSLDWAW